MRFPWRHDDDAGSDVPETGLIHVDDITCSYSGSTRPALEGFSLLAQSGEFVSVLGRSGAGKTTALRALAGFERVESGYVRLGGQLVGSSFVHVPPDKRHVGLVFQDYALFQHLTVEQNVTFGLDSMGKRDQRQRVGFMLELTGLSGLERRYVHELSGGQQQRVALARALAPEPVALLLDEPFSNLDRELRAGLRREVRQIVKEAGATTILVTHDREEALALADRIAVMGEGRVEQIGAPAEVYASPVSPSVAMLVGPCILAPGVIQGGTVKTEAGQFPVNGATGSFADGTSVLALLRASELEITHSAGDSDARVVYREFRGEFTEYGVRLPSGATVRVRRRSAHPFNYGDPVRITERTGHTMTVFQPSFYTSTG